ncbi:MAG: hypothetical protein HFG15_00370 [Bacilli bacterium]|nr:hypothetical protein [Bacilli bacterium]
MKIRKEEQLKKTTFNRMWNTFLCSSMVSMTISNAIFYNSNFFQKPIEMILMKNSPYDGAVINPDKIDINGIDPKHIVSSDDNLELAYLKQVFYENPDLALDDRLSSIFLFLDQYILDNPYFNWDLAYARLKTLTTTDNYIMQKITKSKLPNVAAQYLEMPNCIQYLDSSYDSDISFHEFLHALTVHEDRGFRFFTEGMTQLLTIEYANFIEYYDLDDCILRYFEQDNINVYIENYTLCKILCELLSPELVLEAYSTSNIDLLRKALIEIIGESDTQKFWDCLHTCDEQILTRGLTDTMVNQLFEWVDLIYMKKYGESSMLNQVLQAYYYNLISSLPSSSLIKFYYNSVVLKEYPGTYEIKVTEAGKTLILVDDPLVQEQRANKAIKK